MTEFSDLLSAALMDPFRIVLMIGLVITQRRTKAQTGTLLPLAAGVLFVAVILHFSMGFGANAGMVMAVGAGMLANALILIPILLIAQLLDKRRG